MKLADLTPKVRREKIMTAVNGILREIDTPIPTSQLVKRVTKFLDVAEGSTYVAKEIQKATPDGHPLRRETGETFHKYGREMRRYEWLPSHAVAPRRPPPAQVTPEPAEAMTDANWRAYRVAEIEAGRPDPDDEWTVHPEPPADDFLED